MNITVSLRSALFGALIAAALMLFVNAALPRQAESEMIHGLEFAHWKQGEEAMRLIQSSEGFCALTSVTGSFQGAGEKVHVWVAEDGWWYLGGVSHQDGVEAECVIVRYREVGARTR